MARYPDGLISLIELFRNLPGVGTKTAERFAFHALSWKEEKLQQFGSFLRDLKKNVHFCPSCGAIQSNQNCLFCDPKRRDCSAICVVPYARDVFALEDTKKFHGIYHVIGGLLSPINNYDESHLHLTPLLEKIETMPVQEIVLAFDSTLEGDATAFFLKEKLESKKIRVCRLAFGLPMGSSLEYIDGGTLSKAFVARHAF